MQNNPLYIQSFTEADDALKLHHIVHCSLDVVDERGAFAFTIQSCSFRNPRFSFFFVYLHCFFFLMQMFVIFKSLGLQKSQLLISILGVALNLM